MKTENEIKEKVKELKSAQMNQFSKGNLYVGEKYIASLVALEWVLGEDVLEKSYQE